MVDKATAQFDVCAFNEGGRGDGQERHHNSAVLSGMGKRSGVWLLAALLVHVMVSCFCPFLSSFEGMRTDFLCFSVANRAADYSEASATSHQSFAKRSAQ